MRVGPWSARRGQAGWRVVQAPRWRRIFSTTRGSSITAMTRIGLWQMGQRRGAACQTRRIKFWAPGWACGVGRFATSGQSPPGLSNLWLQEQGPDYADFQWQGGYADFSVSQSNLEEVKQYIAGQEEHHRKLSFQDELRALLRRHEIEWDERYVWD